MSEVDTLFTNKWLTVKEKTLKNGAKYVYASAEWCNSQGVAILPFREKDNDSKFVELEFLGRYEVCPAHSDDIELCSITGGMDKADESPVFTAMRELEEEAGYKVHNHEDMIYLGTVRTNKSSDSTSHLFAVNLDEAKFSVVKAEGDGTLGEEGAYCKWITIEELALQKDPLMHSMLARSILKGIII